MFSFFFQISQSVNTRGQIHDDPDYCNVLDYSSLDYAFLGKKIPMDTYAVFHRDFLFKLEDKDYFSSSLDSVVESSVVGVVVSEGVSSVALDSSVDSVEGVSTVSSGDSVVSED